MPYAYEAAEEGWATWKKVLLILGLVIGVPVIGLVGLGGYMAATQTPEERFDRQVASLPQVSSFAIPLKENFPTEYERLRRNAIAAEKNGIGAVGAASEEFFAGFMKRHADEATQGSDEKLSAYLVALGSAYTQAAKKNTTCAALLAGKSQEMVAADLENVRIFGLVAKTYIEAAASGRDNPTKRGPVTDADKIVVQNAMRQRGFTPQDLLTLGQPSTASGDPVRPCKIMTALVDVISATPPAQKARLTALFAAQR
ncbi:MAG: hypothetical protein ACKOPO_08720 [Novosphingobium sp.]